MLIFVIRCDRIVTEQLVHRRICLGSSLNLYPAYPTPGVPHEQPDGLFELVKINLRK